MSGSASGRVVEWASRRLGEWASERVGERVNANEGECVGVSDSKKKRSPIGNPGKSGKISDLWSGGGVLGGHVYCNLL